MLEERNFSNRIQSIKQLESIVGEQSNLVKRKVIKFVDQHCKDFIAKSPFLVISTSDEFGNCDASPRGDGANFVKVLDDNYLLIPDRPGNKRVDSMRNILKNPKVGLLFIIPGLGETLRINGSAVLIQDEELLDEMKVNGKTPKMAIAIKVEECFIHCAKAFKRSGLWNPETWLSSSDLPAAAKILSEHAKIPDYAAENLEKSYRDELY